MYRRNHVGIEEEFTRIQPAKPVKEIGNKLLSERAIPMIIDTKACLHVKYKIGSNMYTSIKELKIHNGSSNHIQVSTCVNITYKELINDVEV